jgi:hypothetical protein
MLISMLTGFAAGWYMVSALPVHLTIHLAIIGDMGLVRSITRLLSR